MKKSGYVLLLACGIYHYHISEIMPKLPHLILMRMQGSWHWGNMRTVNQFYLSLILKCIQRNKHPVWICCKWYSTVQGPIMWETSSLNHYFPANLASEHADKVVQHELRQQKLLKERQDAFGEAFQQDVQHFKLSGSLPSKYKMSLFWKWKYNTELLCFFVHKVHEVYFIFKTTQWIWVTLIAVSVSMLCPQLYIAIIKLHHITQKCLIVLQTCMT